MLLRSLADLLFVPQCALCDRSVRRSATRPGPTNLAQAQNLPRDVPRDLCPDCYGRILACGLPRQAQLDRQVSPPVFAWGRYDGGLKRAIAALKYDGRRQLATTLAQTMAVAWPIATAQTPLAQGAKSWSIVPIPLHAKRYRERGFNQAEALAIAFADQLGWPILNQGLVRVKETQAQFVFKSDRDRSQNLANAFAIGPSLSRVATGRDLILFDDIYTSGATARAAIATLHAAGHRVRAIAVLARPR